VESNAKIIEVGRQLQYVGHKPFPSRLNGHSYIAAFGVCYCQWKSYQLMFGTLSCKIIFPVHFHCDWDWWEAVCPGTAALSGPIVHSVGSTCRSVPHKWHENWYETTAVLGEEPPATTLLDIPYLWEWTQAFVVRNWWLIAWAVTPCSYKLQLCMVSVFCTKSDLYIKYMCMSDCNLITLLELK